MSEVKKYTKKPVTIEAVHLCEPNTPDDVASWCGGKVCGVGAVGEKMWIDIETLEGIMRADYGDFIIKGVKGEFYPCKPDVFKKTYTPGMGGDELTTLRADLQRVTREREILRTRLENSLKHSIDLDSKLAKTEQERDALIELYAEEAIDSIEPEKEIDCPDCNGTGYTYEHHKKCDGSCSLGLCPVQKQCEKCFGTGLIPLAAVKPEKRGCDTCTIDKSDLVKQGYCDGLTGGRNGVDCPEWQPKNAIETLEQKIMGMIHKDEYFGLNSCENQVLRKILRLIREMRSIEQKEV
jgi:hypothetical protein